MDKDKKDKNKSFFRDAKVSIATLCFCIITIIVIGVYVSGLFLITDNTDANSAANNTDTNSVISSQEPTSTEKGGANANYGVFFDSDSSAVTAPPDEIQTVDDSADYLEKGKEEEEALESVDDKININTATESELMLLDGIGEVLSKRIVETREKLGGYKTISDIMQVPGIGEGRYAKIKDYICVE